MSQLLPHLELVAEDVLLDGRLALFHRRERWLAVADLHFGFEVSQRAAGRLTPMWGMGTVRERLLGLLTDYAPARLLIVGDLVHDAAGAAAARDFLAELAALCETIVIAGNHDRQLAGTVEMVASWNSDQFQFHHGHCAIESNGRTQIIGHHHPAAVIRDGAGLRLKCPAFVQQTSCWIMPAFSPWAAGSNWTRDAQSRVWICTPQRVLLLPQIEPAAG
jgi:DNA ligase-associated metallophosphoesterase